MSRPDTTKQASPKRSTGAGPTRSTMKPDDAWPIEESRKKMDASKPNWAKSQTNAAASERQRVGNTSWKKWEHACAAPTSEIMSQPRRLTRLLSKDEMAGADALIATNSVLAAGRVHTWGSRLTQPRLPERSRISGHARLR